MEIKSKEDYLADQRVVLTLDAGGTNLVFCAMKGTLEIIEPLTLPSVPDNLELILAAIRDGFRKVRKRVGDDVYAISFAFPGPADYRQGIIRDLPNLPAFRGGVALGPFLEHEFGLPVYINNDANLYALGEYLFGFLPRVNETIREHGGAKQYRNLVGITLGSGFGCGLVINGHLNLGDNSNGGELWLMRNHLIPELCVDASVGREKVRRFYAEYSGAELGSVPESEGVYRIAKGEREGNREAALRAFTTIGEIVGEALANASVLVDGLIVIAGGLSGAHEFIMPAVMEQLNGTISHLDGVVFPRIAQKAFYLDLEKDLQEFLRGDQRSISVPFTDIKVHYDAMPRIGVGISRLGASRAIALGAYAFALSAT